MAEKTKPDILDTKVVQANFSAFLYLLAEQQSLIGRLLQVLLENGLISAPQLEKITDLRNEDSVLQSYTQLYNRFAQYYFNTKALLDSDEGIKLIDEAIDKILLPKDK